MHELKVIRINPKDGRPEFRLYTVSGGVPILLQASPSEKFINGLVDDVYDGSARIHNGKITYDFRNL